MTICIPLEGRVRTIIRSSFLSARRTDTTHYDLLGESFQMSGITPDQVILLPDEVQVTESQLVTDGLLVQALPLESFVTVSAEEALPNLLGLLLRHAVADGKLTDAEWQRWYQYAYGDEIEAKETRRRANAAAEQKRAQIAADFADHVSDLINWMYRDLAHLEGEREDQAIRTMHLALYVISAALQTQKVDESMRYLLRAFWNEFQPTFDESVYQALCAKQVMFAEIGEISEKRLGSFWRNLLDNLPPERRVGKDDDLQELLDDTSRLYNYFRDDSAPEIDFAKEIEPYWAAIRLPEEPEEDDEDEEPEEESEPWTDYYEKSAPAEKSTNGGYYQFCKVQFKDGGSPYAYLTGGLPLAVGDFVVVPVGNRNAEKTGRVTDVFVCSAQDAPYPPEKAKFVLRKSERSAAPEKSET